MPESEKDAGASTSFKTSTLLQLGKTLPVGIIDGGAAPVRTFDTRPWRTKEERELAGLRRENMSIGEYVSLIIGKMCTQLGPYDFTAMKDAEKAVRMSQMFSGDVFYLYCYIRYEALGKSLPMDVTCPSCSHRFSYPADLETLEVAHVDKPDDLLWEYSLRHPIQVRGIKVEKLKMSSMRWQHIEGVKADNRAAADPLAKIAAFQGSVVGYNDDPNPIAMSDAEMDEISKIDLEGCVTEINQRTVGPVMALEGKCVKCKTPFIAPISWNSDHFFAVSSQ